MPPYELVTIGASWGGLVACERILTALPAAFGAAIALAQHRSPDSSARLAALLASHTGRDVVEASDKEAIEPGRIYVAPADYHLIVERGHFALSTEAAVQYSRPSIDVLFDTAADAYGDRVIGVLLTGANADGTFGLTRIRRLGGLAVVQDPQTAERPEMPRAAIAAGAADRVVPLDGIAPVLADLCSQAGAARLARPA